MENKTKQTVPVNVRLDKTVKERLDGYCDENGIRKTFVIEKALTEYLDKQGKESSHKNR